MSADVIASSTDSLSGSCHEVHDVLNCRMADWWTRVSDKDKDVMNCERDEEFW